MSKTNTFYQVEVVCALAAKQVSLKIPLENPCSVSEVIDLSKIASMFPEVDFSSVYIGIYGVMCLDPKKKIVCNGDRIEIYRDLICNPQEKMQEIRAKNIELKSTKI